MSFQNPPVAPLADKELYIFDMDGTIYLGFQVFPFAIKFIENLRKAGKRVLFFTNNASHTTAYYVDKLTKLLMALCGLLGVIVVGIAIHERPEPIKVTGTEYGDFMVVAQKESQTAAEIPQRNDSMQATAEAKVNINTASREELMSLDGIGETLSDRIIEERNLLPFDSVEDLMRVKGIGEKILENLRPYIVV